MTITRRHGKTGALTLGALGVVYGDIGTSPLYAIREALAEQGSAEEAVLGVLSLVFWSLIGIISIKYVGFVLRANNDGEGGILALTSLLKSNGSRRLLMLGLFGTALLYGDGVLTPAISVLSAVEGLRIVTPVFNPYVVPITVVILIGLFTVQSRGTHVIGAVFGPIMVVWFLVLAVLGMSHIVAVPGVLAALNPAHIAGVFQQGGLGALHVLGSVFLVVTGGEALYADMGHFGRRPIRIGWFILVLPCLLLNYFGQGALILSDPSTLENPFYLLAPGWALIPLVLLATMASVIASQALISGLFSLTLQAIQLNYAPRHRVRHTSPDQVGQVYLPAVNWALMVACCGLVVLFRTSSNLAAAYGVAVTGIMVITSILFGVVLHQRFGWSAPKAAFLTGAFVLVDTAFLSANLLKISEGGWLPLVIGIGMFTLMTTWHTGRRLVYQVIGHSAEQLAHIIDSIGSGGTPRVPGTAIYLYPQPGKVPPALLANLRHNHVLHESVVLLAVLTAKVPRVPAAGRHKIEDLGNGFFQLTITYGFFEEPDVRSALEGMLSPVSFDPAHTTFFLGRETVRPTHKEGMALWREKIFTTAHRNAASAADYLGLPPDQVIEVGIRVEI